MKEKIPKLSIILPCRNEEQALPYCLANIKRVIKNNKINAEIIVSDSSTDKSPEIARKFGVVLIKHNKEGYGTAYLEAFKHAKGEYIFIADADGTYDFEEIPRFLQELENGYDFVIGNRFNSRMDRGSMPWLHRYVGNPFLSGLFRILFHSQIRDVHCGIRAIKKSALDKLNLRTSGMEFASEMVIKAIKNNLRIKELKVGYHKRKGKSKIKSFSDGWKHLRFMLIYSPIFLFFIPGIILFLIGISTMMWFYFGLQISGIVFFYHPMFISSLLVIGGYQLIIFSAFAKTYSITHLGEKDRLFDAIYKKITIEKASVSGFFIALLGTIIFLIIFVRWIDSGMGALQEVKNSILALTLVVLGIQTIFSSFMLSMLGIKEKENL